MLLDLQPDYLQRGELALEDDAEEPGRGRLMIALDALNERYGGGTVLMASAGVEGDRRAERRTPGYTTRREDIAVAWA
jgi:DNA polymerase V